MSSGESYYRLETADGCLVITLLPVLNDKQWADIERVGTEIVDRLSSAQSPRFIVDLTPLSYMGSAMVALIVRLYKSVNGRNGQMVVVNQHELVFEVLKLAGLTKLWTIVDSRDKAFATLGVKRRGGTVENGTAPSGGNAILIAGIIGTIGAVIGFVLQFRSQALVSRKAALLIDVAFAALGMVAGTMMLVNQTGARRNVGIALLAVCLIAVLGGIVITPEQTVTPTPPSQSKDPAAATTAAPVVTPVATPVSTVVTKPATVPAPTAAPAPTSPAAQAQNPPSDQSGRRRRRDK